MPELVHSTAPVTAADTDAVMVFLTEDGPGDAAREADAALGGAISEMLDAHEVRGRFPERTVIPTLGRLPARRLCLVGLGRPAELDLFRLHNAVQLGTTALRRAGARSLTLYLDPSTAAAASGGADGVAAAVRVAATAVLAANFQQGTLAKTEEDDDGDAATQVERLQVAGVEASPQLDDALRQAAVLAEAGNRVRAWVATPSNRLTPTRLADEAVRLYEGTGLEVEVLTRADLERERMGALLGVAQGSEEPPVMVVVRYDGGRPDGPRLALVGKGITFDTGGISLKPAQNMDAMKTDMGGGAAVLGAMYAIARLRPQANVIGIVPATENMPGGRAYKPGDVLVSMSGKTIEVTNTDAEGRIILADGLAKARALGATHIVDAATLTGAQVVALGHVSSALMSNDDALAGMIQRSAALAAERFDRLPLHPEYEVALRSDVADMKNAAGREAGAITAAFFLREFVGELPWAHLDIAGPAWNDQGDMTHIPKGPSGTPVRTFVHLAFHFARL